MKLKSVFFLLGFFAVTVSANAETEGVELAHRFGIGTDSIQTKRALKMFNIAYAKVHNYEEAYSIWKQLIQKHPYADVNLYIQGRVLLDSLIQRGTNIDEKRTYFEEMVALLDSRMKNLNGLNSIAIKESVKSTTQADIAYQKANAYAQYSRSLYPEKFVVKVENGINVSDGVDETYNLISQANKLLLEQGGREVEGNMLQQFLYYSNWKYNLDKIGFREQFLQDYQNCVESCEKMLQLAKEEPNSDNAREIVRRYDHTLEWANAAFTQSGAADHDQLIAYYTSKVEENRDNIDFLRRALNLLTSNDCDDAPIYYQAAEYAYNIEPTFESAIALAQKYYSEGRTSDAINYYDRAIDLTSNNVQKGNIALRVSDAMRKMGDMRNAYLYIDKAALLNPDIAGKCYMNRAKTAAKEKNYAVAKSYCDKAAAADITLSGQAKRLKQSIQTVEAHNEAYSRQKAEYDKQQAELKREETFWKQGRKK